ncbi:MAG: YkgJ family cysteine cluster protein [Deltaproteobacteria bacterium]|nr:YkgJ family cysteine cluster protein [Deltaproteobacteria bacterium]
MTQSLSPSAMIEHRLGPNDTFNFACHKKISCFNSCCRNKHLPLTPYDVMRLKKALNLHSDDFLSKYTLFQIEPQSGFPVISLKMSDPPTRTCLLVTVKGCRVYEDRPTSCRLYPLGRASGRRAADDAYDEFFFPLDAPNCQGIKETKIQTVAEWREDQGLLPYTRANDRMLNIVFHPRRDETKQLDDRQLQKVIVALYNLDVFREFVFNTEFLKTYEVEEALAERIKEDDEALLDLGFKFLEQALFQE